MADTQEPRSGIVLGPGASVGKITVGGDLVGGDKIEITEDTTYDVGGLPDPYLGLASYTYEARAFYGGREDEVRQAAARLTEPGAEQVVLFVTGDSGCGKSSFVQAGLLPELERSYARRRVRRSVR